MNDSGSKCDSASCLVSGKFTVQSDAISSVGNCSKDTNHDEYSSNSQGSSKDTLDKICEQNALECTQGVICDNKFNGSKEGRDVTNEGDPSDGCGEGKRKAGKKKSATARNLSLGWF